MLPLLMVLIVFATACWVFTDANSIRVDAQKKNPGWIPLDPIYWSMMCLFFWAIAFPIYLFKRSEFRGEIQRRNDIYDNLPDEYKWK